MPFIVDATDRPGAAALRSRNRPDHLAHVEANVGKIIAAGAKLADDSETAIGTLYLIDVDDRPAVEAFIAADPYSRAGVFGTIAITRWRKGFFDFKRLVPRS